MLPVVTVRAKDLSIIDRVSAAQCQRHNVVKVKLVTDKLAASGTLALLFSVKVVDLPCSDLPAGTPGTRASIRNVLAILFRVLLLPFSEPFLVSLGIPLAISFAVFPEIFHGLLWLATFSPPSFSSLSSPCSILQRDLLTLLGSRGT